MRADLAADRVADAEAFAALAPEWWDLWRRSPSATPFQSPAWLIPWWCHFHPGELFAVTIRHAERLVGLAPFYIEDGALGRRILPVGISLGDYLDVLIDPVYGQAAGQALVDFIVRHGERWDGWDLEELAGDAAALTLPVPKDCAETLGPQSACPVLALRADAASIWDVVPARKRRDYNLARNRAARRGGAVIEQADAASAREILDLLFRLHEARWKSRGEAGLVTDEPVRNFHWAALPALMEAGLLRLCLLSIGSEPAAAHYGFAHRHRAYSYLTGFNPDFAFESPGVILLAHALEQAFAEGVREFHFLRGREAYKYEWGAADRWNMRRSFRRLEERLAHA
jgi:CelD/BcsL family acetyltransferase involved in cellulose biosynthesis